MVRQFGISVTKLGGNDFVAHPQEMFSNGFMQFQSHCRRCGGAVRHRSVCWVMLSATVVQGKVILSPCIKCEGSGEVLVPNDIVVTIPEGIMSLACLQSVV